MARRVKKTTQETYLCLFIHTKCGKPLLTASVYRDRERARERERDERQREKDRERVRERETESERGAVNQGFQPDLPQEPGR